MSKTARSRWLRQAVGLALQLVVVFVGVYAAFLLDRHREHVAEQRADDQLYALLIDEVESVAVGLDRQRARFDSLYVIPFVRSPEPRIPLRPYYQINGDLTSPELEALLASGSVASSEADLLPAIRYYNSSARYYTKVSDELRRLSVDRIAPVLGGGSFYDPAGRLLEEYEWYPSLVLQLQMSMEETVASAQRVSTLLRERSEQAGGQP